MSRLWITLIISIPSLGQALAQVSCDSIYTIVDEMPVYKKGNHDLVRDLMQGVVFNRACPPNDIRQFIWTIDKEGKMLDIDIPNLDKECKDILIAQLTKMQPWTPGRQRGRLVCVKMRVSICIKTD